MTAVLLEARHVTKTYGGGLLDRDSTVALEDFSLAIDADRPSITAIVGESGSGKTTLARLLLGLVAPTRARCSTRVAICTHLSGTERRAFRRDVQAIFQDPYGVYNPFYRVDHVLTMPVAQVPARQDQGRGARPDRGRAACGRPAAGGDPRPLSRTSSAAASASASWWRARCCCARI